MLLKFMPRLLVTLLATSLLASSATALQDSQPRFNQGVVSIATTQYGAFLIDKDGFVWIGSTGLGLYRYDGNELKSFASSVPGSMISSIVEDGDGIIWISSFSLGITSYNKVTGKFKTYKHSEGDPQTLGSNNITFAPQKLIADQSNRIWVGTDDAGVSVYDKAKNTWTHHRHDPNNPNSLSDDTVLALAEDKDGTIWIGTQNGGLNHYNPSSDKWITYKQSTNDFASIGDNWINSIHVDRDGDVWVGTKTGGLNRFDRDSGEFSHYLHDADDPTSIGGDEIWSIYEDRAGYIWVCHMVSQSSGLERFDKESETFTRIYSRPNDLSSLSTNAIARVFEDPQSDAMWVLNHNGQLDRHDSNTTYFKHWMHNANVTNSLSDNSILPIVEDSDGLVWVGTMTGGMNKIDRATGKITRYLPNSNAKSSLPRARVTSLAIGSDGLLWIGLWDGILVKFNRNTGKVIKSYQHDPGNPKSITQSERLKFILEDRDDPNILWLATIKGGVDKFDIASETFTHLKHDANKDNGLSNDSVVSLYDDDNGVLWISTYGSGINRLDKRTGELSNYHHVEGDAASLSSDTVYEIIEATNGKLWVSSKGGISLFDPANGTFENFDVDENDIPFGPVSSLLKDNRGDIWLPTIGRGLIRFNPVTHATKHFTLNDGLQGNTFFWTSRHKTSDGQLWFGGANGMTSFDPSQIKENTLVPTIVLTAITQAGEPIDTGTSPEKLKAITIDWNRSYFEFQFSALNFTAPEKNRYAYMLEGWDDDWYYADSIPAGRYSGLTGGTYILRLKGSNNDGVWNEVGTSIAVTVTSPFWETKGFYAFVIFISFGIISVVIFYVLRLRNEIGIRELAHAEQIRAEQALLASEERYQQAQKIESVGRLAGGIAHDLNNLLTPIIGYSEILCEDLKANDPHRESAREINRAGTGARDLVRQLLAFGRKQTLEFKPTDINKTVAEFELLLRRTVREDIEIRTVLNANPSIISADSGQIGQVIMNLAVNAADAMGEGGVMTIKTSTETIDSSAEIIEQEQPFGHYVLLAVSDIGHGMDEETLEHVFEPFYSTKGDKGSGLGMATVYGIVKQHGGYITVDSKINAGTTFNIFLPITEGIDVAEDDSDNEQVEDCKTAATILLVEDYDSLRLLAFKVLERQGYTVLTADSGIKALEILSDYDGPLDLLLTDVIMPKMTGKELFVKISQTRSDLKVLYMSGYSEEEISQRGVLNEGIEFIQKPFTIEDLATKVQKLLGDASQ